MKRLIGCAVIGALGACTTGTTERPRLTPSAANFTYYTPATKLSLVGDLVLLRCDPEAVVAASTLALVSAPAADRTVPFTLHGAYLTSAMQRRELAIDLYENGTIKSLNATTTDRTGAVIQSILRTAVSIAGAVAGVPPVAASSGEGISPPPPPGNGGPCNEATHEALLEIESLRETIASEQQALRDASPTDVEGHRQRIDSLANQLAALITSRLTINLTRKLNLGDGPAEAYQPIRWTFADLAKWFGPPASRVRTGAATTDFCVAENERGRSLFRPAEASSNRCEDTTDYFGLSYRVTAPSVAEPVDRIAASPCRPRGDESLRAECGRTIVMPQPVSATAQFRTDSANITGHNSGAELGDATFLVPQWGAATYLPLNVRMFQTRSIGYTFSAFGERQSFKWNSEATAENATSMISTATDTALTGIRNVSGESDTVRWTAEAAELEARMKLNRLRNCELAISAGATTCPEE